MPMDLTSSLFAALATVAAGRGASPDEGGGVLIIVLTIVAVIVVVGTILTLVVRKTRG